MSIKAVSFDLDSTLLPIDQNIFTKQYLKLLSAKLAPYGYEPAQLIDAIWSGTAAMVKNPEAICLCLMNFIKRILKASELFSVLVRRHQKR